MLNLPTPAGRHHIDLRRRTLGAALLLAFVLLPTTAFAHTHGGYSHDPTIGYTNTDWLSQLPDDRRLSELSIPGTHDSGAYVHYSSEFVRTQTMDLPTQLQSGIRAWDIRLGFFICSSELDVYHGFERQDLLFGDYVLLIAQTFLTQHPDEVIFMRIKHEYGCPTNNFGGAVWEAFARYPGLLYLGSDNNPTLGSMRGQVVVLQDYAAADVGIPWGSLHIQDDYNVPTLWDVDEKWESIRVQLGLASNGNPNTIYVNFLSGAVGAYPYFVASGHDEPATDASHWLQGFDGTNILTTERIQAGSVSHAGIVMADFPGPDLVASVIGLNDPGIFYEAESDPAIYHRIGRAIVEDGWSAKVNDDLEGHLAYGPYASDLGVGDKTVVFRALIGDASPGTQVALLDVWDATAHDLLASRIIYASDFAVPKTYENLYLHFNLDGREAHEIETRVWWFATVDMHLDLIKILEPPFLFKAYEAESDPKIYHNVGRAVGDGWAADPQLDAEGTLVYGPYATYLGKGDHFATFRVQADNHSFEGGVFFLDVWDATANEPLASRIVKTIDFPPPVVLFGSPVHFPKIDLKLSFNLDGREGHEIETRAWWHGFTFAKIDFIRIDQQ